MRLCLLIAEERQSEIQVSPVENKKSPFQRKGLFQQQKYSTKISQENSVIFPDGWSAVIG